jgi:hypothetical protein
MRLGSRKPHTYKQILSLLPNAVTNASWMEKSKPVDSVSFYLCI